MQLDSSFISSLLIYRVEFELKLTCASLPLCDVFLSDTETIQNPISCNADRDELNCRVHPHTVTAASDAAFTCPFELILEGLQIRLDFYLRLQFGLNSSVNG